jgi:hypothetical protein
MFKTATSWNTGGIAEEKAARRRATWSPFEVPTREEIAIIAVLLGLSVEAIGLAAARRLLFCATCRQEHRSFIITDSHRLCAAAYRLDGQPWEQTKRIARILPGSLKEWPIGIAEITPFPAIAITETGADLLCAMHLIWCAAREQIIAALALLSRTPISEQVLKSFRNKHICLFPHANRAEEICNHWSDQLREAGALAVEEYSFAELINPDGSSVQTLHDFVRIDAEVRESHYDPIESAFLFGPEPVASVAPAPFEPQPFSSTRTIKKETANGGPF